MGRPVEDLEAEGVWDQALERANSSLLNPL